MRLMRKQLEAANYMLLVRHVPGANGASATIRHRLDARGWALQVPHSLAPQDFYLAQHIDLVYLRSRSESWRKLKQTPVPERLALIQDQAFREALIRDGKAMELAQHIG